LGLEIKSGGVLLSHAVTHVVPSALQGLTTEFGMGSGVTPAAWPPETMRRFSVFGNTAPARRRCHQKQNSESEVEKSLTVTKGKREYGQAARPISTGRLHTLLRFHLRPINLVVYQGPLGILRSGRSNLEVGFPLRCFQRLSGPNIATRRCAWRHNRNTRGSSIPVLSY
jgi:hypothetical protein